MIDTLNSHTSNVTEPQQEASLKALEKIFSAAQSKAVYGEPVTAGNYTIITACEVFAAGGTGFGSGTGPATSPTNTEQAQVNAPVAEGGGGGGGGVSIGRPIACIVIGPDGVKVQPILDVAKVAIAGITTWKAVATILSKMRK